MICSCGTKMTVANCANYKGKTIRKQDCKNCGKSYFTIEVLCKDQEAAANALYKIRNYRCKMANKRRTNK